MIMNPRSRRTMARGKPLLRESGFTLLERSIVVFIAGLMMVAAASVTTR